MEIKEITILCKVVDNFGDVGVMYRMAKQLLVVNSDALKINIVIDDLVSFNKINSKIDSKKDFQQIDGLNIYNWNNYELCLKHFSENDGEKLSVILELFQCGRPQWLDKILFEDKLERTVQIIMIDYLTAEKYAEDFHCLQSLTRSAKVQKVNFMPGFTEKTGGLIIDEQWGVLSEYNPQGPALVFTYERNWLALADALNISALRKVFVAQGRGRESFVKAWNDGKCNAEKLSELEYLNQTEWDCVMKQCSVLFIRGEESMSRACLSGIPFVWHAYPQSEEYQLVKMNALLERMERHFEAEDFKVVRKVWVDFNTPEKDVDGLEMKADISAFINAREKLRPGFKKFAESLLKNGDLCKNLLDYIKSL